MQLQPSSKLKSYCAIKMFVSLYIILHLWNFYAYVALKIFEETL